MPMHQPTHKLPDKVEVVDVSKIHERIIKLNVKALQKIFSTLNIWVDAARNNLASTKEPAPLLKLDPTVPEAKGIPFGILFPVCLPGPWGGPGRQGDLDTCAASGYLELITCLPELPLHWVWASRWTWSFLGFDLVPHLSQSYDMSIICGFIWLHQCSESLILSLLFFSIGCWGWVFLGLLSCPLLVEVFGEVTYLTTMFSNQIACVMG